MYKAADKIRDKEQKQLYKKVGKKYVPVSMYDELESLPEGWWLVKVTPGCRSMKACMYPDNAELEAAMKDAQDKIVDILNKATQARPRVKPITPEFKRAWERMVKKFGSEMNMLEYDSLYGIAETILKEVMNNKRK